MKEYKIQQLRERYNEYCSNSEDGGGDGMSFAEYVEREANNDPRFFAWLFDAEDVERFDELKEEQKTEFKKLLKK